MKALWREALIFAVAGCAPLAFGQTTQPCSASPQPAPCKANAAPDSNKPATDKFPFPGEGSATAPASAAPAATTDKSDAPAAPAAAPDAPTAPSGKQFPFPGEPGGSGGSSSSSSSSDSAAPVPDASGDATPDAGGRRLLKRVNPTGEKLQSPADREAEDLKVAKFYTDSGDLNGAYLRSQDAVKTVPDDPDAHCMLAETAQKLNKRDEAISEFNACLKLDPVDKQAKNARKQLAKLK